MNALPLVLPPAILLAATALVLWRSRRPRAAGRGLATLPVAAGCVVLGWALVAVGAWLRGYPLPAVVEGLGAVAAAALLLPAVRGSRAA